MVTALQVRVAALGAIGLAARDHRFTCWRCQVAHQLLCQMVDARKILRPAFRGFGPYERAIRALEELQQQAKTVVVKLDAALQYVIRRVTGTGTGDGSPQYLRGLAGWWFRMESRRYLEI